MKGTGWKQDWAEEEAKLRCSTKASAEPMGVGKLRWLFKMTWDPRPFYTSYINQSLDVGRPRQGDALQIRQFLKQADIWGLSVCSAPSSSQRGSGWLIHYTTISLKSVFFHKWKGIQVTRPLKTLPLGYTQKSAKGHSDEEIQMFAITSC